MSLVQIITLLATIITAGWFAAFLVQLIKRAQWASWIKLVLAVVVSALVGLATAWLAGDVTNFVTIWKQGTITSNEVITFATLIFASAQIWYHKFFQDQQWALTLGAWGSKK
jgi:general stress protein CsbA